jgi:hypothetical protein
MFSIQVLVEHTQIIVILHGIDGLLSALNVEGPTGRMVDGGVQHVEVDSIVNHLFLPAPEPLTLVLLQSDH